MVMLAQAQMVQNLRGKITDKDSQFPLVGVNVIIVGSNPVIGATTDAYGEFIIRGLKVGRCNLQCSYLGYKPQTINDINLSSGKEVVIQVEMEELVITTEEVTIQANRKGETLNKMASVSAKTFTVDETERYAGSLGDPARMASNFAGVSRAGDDRNDIIIRGNSPTGLLWRLEGINIPNPNHWGASGATGGPVSILNNNTLSNSDFMTAAFPAEYGNALSGVFDLNMRSGNNQKREFTGQVGFGGFELMAEGPFSKNYRGSYMVSYRYSVMGMMDLIGFHIAGGVVPQYSDLTFKVDLPTEKAGHFAIFGIGGRSEISMLDEKMVDKGKFNTAGGTDTYNGSDLAILGLTHRYFFNEKTQLYSTVSVSGTRVYTTIDSVKYRLTPKPEKITDTIRIKSTELFYGEKNNEIISTFSTRLTHKMNAKNTFSFGMGVDHHQIAYQDSFLNIDANPRYYIISTDTKKSGLFIAQAHTEWQHKFTDELVLNTGVFFQEFMYNKTYAVEPRVGFTYEPVPGSKFSLGYGLHSRMQPIFMYFIESEDTITHTYRQTNNKLDFTKAQHLVAGYSHMFNENLHLKLEAYYQDLYKVPVTEYSSNFSMLNEGASFHLDRVDSLVNKGKGKNYGIDLTIEKYLENNWYFLFTGSLFDSKYTGSDGVERSTAFASNFSTNVLGGYEYRINDKNTIDMNLKVTWAGGKRNYYLDEAATLAKGEEVYDDNRAFENREKDYFRLDFRIAWKINGTKMSQEMALDITNLTNYKNIYSKGYDAKDNKIINVYQQGFYPMMLYRINF